MRTKILALALVLLATPAWAAVTISGTAISPTQVAIKYDARSESPALLPRAFALDLAATAGNIVSVGGYAIGDDNKGYGIFPGNFSRYITVNPTTGEVDDWGVAGYTPVADGGDPGAAGALGTSAITIEMGSLYDTNVPDPCGILCTVTVSAGTTQLCITGNAIRGNIVMEDASERTLPAPPGVCVPLVVDCIPNIPTYAIQYADWVLFGKPRCWCSAASLPPPIEDLSDTGLVNYTAGNFQCDGDAATDRENPLLKWRVSASDLNLVIANWKKNISAADPCADVKHDFENPLLKWRVSASDLNRLISNWKKNRTQLPGNCPRPDGSR